MQGAHNSSSIELALCQEGLLVGAVGLGRIELAIRLVEGKLLAVNVQGLCLPVCQIVCGSDFHESHKQLSPISQIWMRGLKSLKLCMRLESVEGDGRFSAQASSILAKFRFFPKPVVAPDDCGQRDQEHEEGNGAACIESSGCDVFCLCRFYDGFVETGKCGLIVLRTHLNLALFEVKAGQGEVRSNFLRFHEFFLGEDFPVGCIVFRKRLQRGRGFGGRGNWLNNYGFF